MIKNALRKLDTLPVLRQHWWLQEPWERKGKSKLINKVSVCEQPKGHPQSTGSCPRQSQALVHLAHYWLPWLAAVIRGSTNGPSWYVPSTQALGPPQKDYKHIRSSRCFCYWICQKLQRNLPLGENREGKQGKGRETLSLLILSKSKFSFDLPIG